MCSSYVVVFVNLITSKIVLNTTNPDMVHNPVSKTTIGNQTVKPNLETFHDQGTPDAKDHYKACATNIININYFKVKYLYLDKPQIGRIVKSGATSFFVLHS